VVQAAFYYNPLDNLDFKTSHVPKFGGFFLGRIPSITLSNQLPSRAQIKLRICLSKCRCIHTKSGFGIAWLFTVSNLRFCQDRDDAQGSLQRGD
jgi:hypothetical protein